MRATALTPSSTTCQHRVCLQRATPLEKMLLNYTHVQKRVLGSGATILRAVDGYNHTEVLQRLLESKLQFHGLSTGAKKWGKLATFLTKYRSLEYQVRHGIPFVVHLEEDVLPIPRKWAEMMAHACVVVSREPGIGYQA